MFLFGRDPDRRKTDSGAFGDRLSADPTLMQLLPLGALRAEASDNGLAAYRALGPGSIDAPQRQSRAFLRQALLLQEIGRRTGEVETLGRAASAVLRARELGDGQRRMVAEALLRHADVLTLAGALFSDPEAFKTAAQRLDEIQRQGLDPILAARMDALRANLQARAAQRSADASDCRAAAAALAAAAKILDRLVRGGKVDASEAHEVRCDLCDLLIGAAGQTKDRAFLDEAFVVLASMSQAIDRNYRPLSWARMQVLKGQALARLGDLLGDAHKIAEGVEVLREAVEEIDETHSPLDAVRAGHALAVTLQSLGEACDDDGMFDRSINVFSPVLAALEVVPHLPLRSVVVHDAAACLARRAERRGDLASLEAAEAAFREALKGDVVSSDPLAWAVTQVALARIYEVEAELRGDRGERRDAAFALASALEVFAEHGLRSLSDVALTALARIKATA